MWAKSFWWPMASPFIRWTYLSQLFKILQEYKVTACILVDVIFSKCNSDTDIVKRAYSMRLRFWEASFADYPGANTLNNGRLVYEYIITNLLPLWRKCCQCSKWRQIPIQFSFKLGLTKSRFVCSEISGVDYCLFLLSIHYHRIKQLLNRLRWCPVTVLKIGYGVFILQF